NTAISARHVRLKLAGVAERDGRDRIRHVAVDARLLGNHWALNVEPWREITEDLGADNAVPEITKLSTKVEVRPVVGDPLIARRPEGRADESRCRPVAVD